MKLRFRTRPLFLPAVGLVAFFLAGGRAEAELIVYEGFQYAEVGEELNGQPDDPGGTDIDATGFDGTWADLTPSSGSVPANDMFLKAGSLIFGDLATAGNHIGFLSNANNDTYHRTLTTGAQASVGGAEEIWFSILFEKLQNNFSAGEGGFALSNQVVGNPRIFENGGTTPVNGLAGFGFGPTTAGDDLKPYAWDGTNLIAGDTAISVPPANGSSNTNGSNFGDVRLLVGQISFDTGAGGADEYTLYDYALNAGSVVGGTLNAIASPIEVDVDQSLLDTVNLTRQVNLNYDELRIGTTLASVLDGAEQPAFVITQISYDPGADSVTLTWSGREGVSYIARYSTDLTDWGGDIGDGLSTAIDEVPDDGDRITETFVLPEGLKDLGDLFFRIEEE